MPDSPSSGAPAPNWHTRLHLAASAVYLADNEDDADEAMIVQDRLITDAAALLASTLSERDALKAEVARLTTCSCGRTLSTGQCGICDNDD